jgi:hypothetical protein
MESNAAALQVQLQQLEVEVQQVVLFKERVCVCQWGPAAAVALCLI